MAALHFVERQLRNNSASALCAPAVCLEDSIERDRDSLERGGYVLNLVCEASLSIGYWRPGE
jgi:hypothetical protein